MHVRKFEGDSLEEVIKQVKKELGPDAIILKTKTNKGIGGAFRKNRVEITAAISESSYIKKAKVDRVLPDEVKETFYQAPSSEINKTIQSYSSPTYGAMGLNKNVQMKTNKLKDKVVSTAKSFTSSLDDFLTPQPKSEQPLENRVELHEFISDIQPEEVEVRRQEKTLEMDYSNHLKSQEEKIKALEEKLMNLMQDVVVSSEREKGPHGISELKTTLKTLDLNNRIITKLIKKINASVSYKDQDDSDVVFDVALRELDEIINTKQAMFSQVVGRSSITVFLSEGASGQSSAVRKLSSIREGSKVIKIVREKTKRTKTDKLLGIDIVEVTSIAEVVTECRKEELSEKALFIDVNPNLLSNESIKDLVEHLKRNFSSVEVLLNISAIHSEIYNRKNISKYSHLIDGIIINHIDKCLNFGALVNVHEEFGHIPLVFYGTGRVIPEDIEAATSERLIASLFRI